MIDFYTIFYQLESSGFYQYFLPFLLVFVIIFAILEKTYIFGKDANQASKTNINVVVAFIIGLFLITRTDLVLIMNDYLSKMSFFIVIGIMVLIVAAMFYGREIAPRSMTLPIVIAIIAAIWSLASSAYGGNFPYWFYLSDSSLTLVLGVGVIAVVVWLLVTSSKNPPTAPAAPGAHH